MTTLDKINKHPRDARIRFEEEPHEYYIDGSKEGYISVTTIIKSKFEPFDPQEAAKKAITSPNNPCFGMTVDEAIAHWNTTNSTNNAAQQGTDMHRDIEYYLNKLPYENTSIEFSYFLNFMEDYPEYAQSVYRTEWIVFDEELKIAGSIDVVFKNEDGTLDIGDWKRSKRIYTHGFNGKYGKDEFEHIQDCNFCHYSLQLNMYKWILENKYGQTVRDMFLIVCHPNNQNKNYQKYDIPEMQDDIKLLVNTRRKTV